MRSRHILHYAVPLRATCRHFRYAIFALIADIRFRDAASAADDAAAAIIDGHAADGCCFRWL